MMSLQHLVHSIVNPVDRTKLSYKEAELISMIIFSLFEGYYKFLFHMGVDIKKNFFTRNVELMTLSLIRSEDDKEFLTINYVYGKPYKLMFDEKL